MANRSFLQPTFSGGELSPALWGRVDLARYQNSLKTCRNFIVKQQGGIDNRPGTRFVAAAKYPNRKCRLIEFQFSTDQTYVIELGHQYMRVFRDGGPIMDGGSPLEVATPWTEAQVFDVNFVQSADVMTLVHPEVAPHEIRRLADDDWEVVEFTSEVGPFQDANLDETITVTANSETGTVTLTASKSLFRAEHVGTYMHLEQVDTGDIAAWMNRADIQLGDLRYAEERVYEAVELSTPGNPGGTLTGDLTPVHTEGEAWDGPRTAALGIEDILGVKWRYLHSGFGIVRITAVNSTTSATATVTKRLPSTIVDGNTYKWSMAAWNSVRGYPRAVTYHQQRLVFAGSPEQPQSFWMSETGIFKGFGTHRPVEASDAISYTISSRQVNEIRHLIEMNQLLAFTSGAEWTISSVSGEGLSADTISVEPQNYRGASKVAPIVVGSNVLYIQSRGRAVRDLGYSFDIDGFTGNDLTILSSHLFERWQLVDWGFIQTPYSAALAVRSDGTLLTMTYLREQSVVGWAHHDTRNGAFESVACIPEDQEDYAYFVVRRQVNGQTVRYIERMETRLFDDVEDAYFVDCGLSYDGRNTSDTTLTLSDGTTWGYPEELTLTASEATFDAGQVGRFYRLRHDVLDSEGVQIASDYAVLEVIGYTSDTVVTVRTERLVPESLRDTAVTQWALMAQTLSGLDHLEGQEVSILADGNVEPLQTVTGGEITLQFPAAISHVGLGITSDMATLAISHTAQDGSTNRDNLKLVHGVALQVESSRGVFAGQSPEDLSFQSTDYLNELKQRSTENWGEPTDLATGLVDVKIDSRWDSEGAVFVRQTDPLPLSILGVILRMRDGGKR
ncbi:hypothetical protein [Halomonas cupida]|uniref:hypothetical protein n=1 Tax=Halomonas cupida TaxID=44933 RepID=UPI003A929C83